MHKCAASFGPAIENSCDTRVLCRSSEILKDVLKYAASTAAGVADDLLNTLYTFRYTYFYSHRLAALAQDRLPRKNRRCRSPLPPAQTAQLPLQ